MGWSNSSCDDVDGSPVGGARRVVSKERNNLQKFHISIKLEKMDDRAEQCRCSGISKDTIIGIRKCYKTNIYIMAWGQGGEVFAVRRVFWAESDQNPLRIFLTPNGRDRAKFSDQIPSMFLSRIQSELNLSPSSINLLKKCWSRGLNLGPTSI